MVKENRRTILVSIVLVVLFIIGVIAASYAYFVANVTQDNEENRTIDVTTANISATFTDGPQIKITNLIPGDTYDKTFTLENNGGTTIRYKIVMNNVTNTFINKNDVEVVIKEGENVINTTIFPSETAAISGENILSVKPGETKSYTITIHYINQPDVDQYEDMDKSLSAKIFIEEV